MKRNIFFILLCIIAYMVNAQDIKLIADDNILQKLENQKVLNNPEAKHNGYRYQIFQGASRNDAYAANGNFLNAFPEMPAYVLYEPPNFKVRVGDFRFKFEALAFKQQMISNGINNFYIVHDKINVPKPR